MADSNISPAIALGPVRGTGLEARQPIEFGVSGVAGEVVAVNDTLNSNPGTVNTDPFEAGWMIKVKPANPSELDGLLDADAYAKSSGH